MRKRQDLQITSVTPAAGAPGGELTIRCRGFVPGLDSKVFFGQTEAFILSASEDRIIVRLPESPQSLGLMLQVGTKTSEIFAFNLAAQLAGGLHPVTSPIIASDGSIITTISGSRGQEILQPIIRITQRGEKIPYPCDVMNPTGLAFSKNGQLYITSRNDGTVLRYTNFEKLEVVAEEMGIPCGIVFDSQGFLYVGDRTGRIFKINESGSKEEFASLEASIAAYHLAIDAEDNLYVSGPTFSMRDRLYKISPKGKVSVAMEGLARPQGMAFLPEGDLLIAAGYQGMKGIFRYSPFERSLKHYLAAPIPAGLAVSDHKIYLASNDAIYSVDIPDTTPVN
jgi:hypothetical protein